jgi:hypothetical protein
MATRYKAMTRAQRDAANARNKKWKARNKDKVRAYKQAHYRDNREKYVAVERDRQYRKRYGITLRDYEAMLAKQGGACAICGSRAAGPKQQAFAVDHCHDTLTVRGLLCITCNAKLGWLWWFERYRDRIATYLATREG